LCKTFIPSSILSLFSYLPVRFIFHPFILSSVPDTVSSFLFSFCLLYPCAPVLYPVQPCPTLCPVSLLSYILIFPVLGAGICRVPCPSSWTRGPPPPSSPLPSDLATIPIFSWQSHDTFPFLPCSLPIPLLHLSWNSHFFAKIQINLLCGKALRIECSALFLTNLMMKCLLV
jgi:hypothetical protein